jgi:hypothetical protein
MQCTRNSTSHSSRSRKQVLAALDEDTIQNCDVCVEMSNFTTQLNSHHNGLQIMYVKIHWVSCRLLSVCLCVCVCTGMRMHVCMCVYMHVCKYVRTHVG